MERGERIGVGRRREVGGEKKGERKREMKRKEGGRGGEGEVEREAQTGKGGKWEERGRWRQGGCGRSRPSKGENLFHSPVKIFTNTNVHHIVDRKTLVTRPSNLSINTDKTRSSSNFSCICRIWGFLLQLKVIARDFSLFTCTCNNYSLE